MFPLQLVKDEQLLKTGSAKDIFIAKVVNLEQQTLTTDYGFCCFRSFYYCSHSSALKLEDWDMVIGKVWKVICTGEEGVAHKAIVCMKDICTNPDFREKVSNVSTGWTRERRGSSVIVSHYSDFVFVTQ